MALSRERIVDEAHALLTAQGLAGTSMRRVAQALGVQAGALYYYVPSKHELLVEIAARILAVVPRPTPDSDVRRAADDVRAALLRVRDGAEVVSFAHAYRPEALAWCRELPVLFGQGLGPDRAEWAARTLVHYILGFVAEEQNRIELVRTSILPADPADGSAEAFRFGVDAIVAGVQACSNT